MCKTHKMHGSRTYRTWRGVKARCLNPNDPAYPRYGGRGITVDPAWLDFTGFLADMGVRPDGLELDRINNDDGYYKENCRWVTRTVNGRNKRDTVKITIGGTEQPLIEVAERAGIRADTLRYRLQVMRMSISEALAVKPGEIILDRRAAHRNSRSAKFYDFQGRKLLLVEVAEALGMPRDVLAWRVKNHGFSSAVSQPYTPRGRTHAD